MIRFLTPARSCAGVFYFTFTERFDRVPAAAFNDRSLEMIFPKTKHELAELLHCHQVNFSVWGKGGAKSLDDLFVEVEKHETKFSVFDGVLLRDLVLARLDIWWNDLKLVERAVIRNDIRVASDKPVSASEKMFWHETPQHGVGRLLEEEIYPLISREFVAEPSFLSQKDPEFKKSPGYPGLCGRYHYFDFSTQVLSGYRPIYQNYSCCLSEEFAVPDGNKLVIFSWECPLKKADKT